MPISDRDYVRGKHPPTCTCKECTERRLGKVLSQNPDKRRKDPQKTKPAILRTITPPRFLRRMWRKIPLGIHKLILSLLVIAGLADIIRRGYILFAHQTDPIKNTIIFLLEVGLWIWIVVILRSRRYRYRQPKFKLVLITIIAITLVCTFAGIEPLSSYKDNLFDSINDYLEEQRVAREVAERAAEEARIEAEALARAETERKAAEAKEEGLKITPVTPPEITKITPALRNPSWEELKAFLWEDKTDQLEYIFPTFVCDNFARTLQANAKEAGWRCAHVRVRLVGYPDWFNYGIPSNTGHSLNAFETTDRGLVYIDCTSTHGFSGNADKIIDVKIGKEYIGKSIFPTPGWGGWLSMGTVVGIETTQW